MNTPPPPGPDAGGSSRSDGPGDTEPVFRDADPAITAAVHLPLFEKLVDPALPLIDVGCGNGTRTAFLAGCYRPVIGIDISAAAVERARSVVGEAVREAPQFRQLDAADTQAMRRLHNELGDANVYLRGAFRRSEPADRLRIAESVAVLVGERGRAFVVEPAAAATAVPILQRPEGPPAPVAALLARGITPTGVDDAALPELFRSVGLRVQAAGSLPLATTEFERDGSRVDLPSNWLVVGRNE